jgi:hypothetical protein
VAGIAARKASAAAARSEARISLALRASGGSGSPCKDESSIGSIGVNALSATAPPSPSSRWRANQLSIICRECRL